MIPRIAKVIHINSLKFKEIVRHSAHPSIFGHGPCSEDPDGPVMSTFTDRLGKLKEQMERLVCEHKQLQEHLADQERTAREHQRTHDVLKARVNELERENEVLRKAERAVAGSTNDPGTKERIDELVAEIDRCLELLKPIER